MTKYREPILEPLLRKIRFDLVLKHITPGSTVVDLGCGHTPNFLNRLASYIDRGIGIDPLIKDKSGKKIQLISKMLTDRIPLESNSVDHVTLIAVLEHLDSPRSLLKEARRILKPGGTLLLTTPTPLNKPLLEFLAFRVGIVSTREIAEHKRYFWRGELTEYVTSAGFKNPHHNYFEIFLNNFLLARK